MENPIDTMMKMALGGILALLLRAWWEYLREKRDGKKAFVEFLTRWKSDLVSYPAFPHNFNVSYLETVPKVKGEADVVVQYIPKGKRTAFNALVAGVCGFSDQYTADSKDTEVKKEKITASIEEIVSFVNGL